MYERFREDPDSVGESWREFFEDYRSQADLTSPHGIATPTPSAQPNGTASAAPSNGTAPAPETSAPTPRPVAAPSDPEGSPIRAALRA